MTIIDTQNLAEIADFDEDASPREDMAATEDSDPAAKIEFHVQMRSWTLRDMETLIVEAAASQMIRSFGDKKFAKQIEDSAIAAITAKADAKMEKVSADIIDQPLTPAFGDKKPVTMREFIGLYTAEYLTAPVGSDGKPTTDTWGQKQRRIDWIVSRLLDAKFKREIEAATNAAVAQVQKEIRERHTAILAAETARIRDALAKAVS